MKKTMIALAAAAAVGGAFAQATITPYGVLDLNIKNTAAGTTIGSGGYSGSRFGAKAAVDIGGGMKLDGMFETSITPTAAANTQLGDRGANVALSGGFGSVRLGNQFTPSAYSWFNDATEWDGFALGPGAPIAKNTVWKNGIMYTSPTVAGFTGMVMAGPATDGSGLQSLGASFAPVPELAVTAAWEALKDTAGVTTTAYNAGVAYHMGPVTAYLDVNSADNGTNKDNGWLVSASAPVSGTWAVQAAYASNTVNYTAASTYTGATLVLVNDIHKQVRLYTGVKHGTVTGAADTNGYYAGLRLSF